ncbi:hypothetical protein EV363DRAFT_1400232 [Boletus edulis]|nr:hypothetical protein EV363DRAFT_1400232 [Boletus edulis]
MPFLSRRSVDPLTPTSPFRPRNKGYPQKPSDLQQTPRNRARSEASLLRRVSTLFTARRRIPSKTSSFSKPKASSPGIEYKCSRHWSMLPRVSSDTTPQSSLEIRRPSGLGRRASILESDDSLADSEGGGEQEARMVPTGFASLPNLLSGAFHSPGVVRYPPLKRSRMHSTALPDSILRVVVDFISRNDLTVVALVSRGFCTAVRHALYHSLDVQTFAESSLRRLYDVLAHREELAALVVSFYCHSWPSWDLSSNPSDDVRQALQNMYNLKSLTIASFASILSYTPSLTFSLTHLTILDKKITQSQLVVMRSWLATQPSLESLSFPHLVECTSADPAFIDEWALVADPSQANDDGPFSTILPGLKSLRASTEIVLTLCTAMHNPIKHLTLDVHGTLYKGLRPSGGVRDMHIIFAPEVDKRTVEKFLGVTGSMLTGEDKTEAMKSLEVEVSWTDDDAAETLYGIVTSIISRFRGLETLKLTSPFRSIQAPVLVSRPVSQPLLCPPSAPFTSPDGEFVACGTEKNYARTWTKQCPSLSDIQFDFSCSTTDVDVELCGVWYRRKMPMSLS